MKRREFLTSLAAATVAGKLASAGWAAEGPKALQTRVLGKTGVEVTCMALGGVVGIQRPPAEFNSEELANAAIDLGIHYFDTAPGYNKTQSETNYGRVFVSSAHFGAGWKRGDARFRGFGFASRRHHRQLRPFTASRFFLECLGRVQS